MFEFSSIDKYHLRLREGSTTCVQAVEHFLQAIKNKQHLNAFLEVYAEEALQKAKKLDKRREEGQSLKRLHGVVIAIKDVLCYKDHKISASSKILDNFISVYSATAVEKLLAEDAIIVGRTNCDEFAMGSSNENSFYGKVLNAANETKVSGGSSGGSAVAVQAGLCMVSLGSDTGGSVRQPADFCGIIGLKPTYGRISRYGLIAYASSFDQIGIFGKNIPDVARMLEVIAGPDEYDSTASSRSLPKEEEIEKETHEKSKYHFTYFKEALDHPGIDHEISTSIKNFIEHLKEDGHKVKPVEFDLFDYIVPTYYVLTTAEASSNLSRYDGVRYGYRTPDPVSDLTEFYKRTRTEGFGKEVKRRIMLGTFVLSAGYYDAYYSRAQKIRRLIKEKIEKIFKDFDFILMPASPTTAFTIGEKMNDPIAMYLADIYTVLANLAGVPAIAIPLFQHSNGMPFGLQLLAKRFDEMSLLSIAHQLMTKGDA